MKRHCLLHVKHDKNCETCTFKSDHLEEVLSNELGKIAPDSTISYERHEPTQHGFKFYRAGNRNSMMALQDLLPNVLERMTSNCYHVVQKKHFDRIKLPGFLDADSPSEDDLMYCYIDSDYGTPFRLTCSKEGKYFLNNPELMQYVYSTFLMRRMLEVQCSFGRV